MFSITNYSPVTFHENKHGLKPSCICVVSLKRDFCSLISGRDCMRRIVWPVFFFFFFCELVWNSSLKSSSCAAFLSAIPELIEVNLWFAALASGTGCDITRRLTVACSLSHFTYLQTASPLLPTSTSCWGLYAETGVPPFPAWQKMWRHSSSGAANDLFSSIFSCQRLQSRCDFASPAVSVTVYQHRGCCSSTSAFVTELLGQLNGDMFVNKSW